LETPPSSEGAHRARAEQQAGSDPANDQSDDSKHWKELEQYHSEYFDLLQPSCPGMIVASKR
jgi:hypothetical protein